MSVQRTTRFIINLIIFGSSKALNIYNIMDDIFTQELDGQYTELNPNPSYKTQIIHNIFGTKPPNENIEYTNTDKF